MAENPEKTCYNCNRLPERKNYEVIGGDKLTANCASCIHRNTYHGDDNFQPKTVTDTTS